MSRAPDDPHHEPTQMADYSGNGHYGGYSEPAYDSQYRQRDRSTPPTPWYQRPVALVGLGALTAILITLLVWSMVRLVHRQSDPGAPATPTTTAPAGERSAPAPQWVPPGAPPGASEPPAPETEPPTSPPPATTEPPTTTTGSTEPPTTTEPPGTTTAPNTTTAPATPTTTRQPPAIVIPLPGR
ncbi:hypothetical protein [Mycolicibacter hiberniae]|uniref:Uncharacterized protein n=1 Tax=Mycolicibacter hiberniae TaxID=29314 RepID=A0A7I7X790_9MYCO|nr:hypothetical protein [Mycolicibacter hiberniae]MCV7087351.1 hypothetical protein [Mycolicibacter hiberniae]ORV67682.1 hypothetical protein AWC09_15990 [Mycolicibacter hiberniae]BBZ25434.1 hypothetical protein MHIB_38520 [Mycolicibacter hiberniae]